jgi:hypothetical protein
LPSGKKRKPRDLHARHQFDKEFRTLNYNDLSTNHLWLNASSVSTTGKKLVAKERKHLKKQLQHHKTKALAGEGTQIGEDYYIFCFISSSLQYRQLFGFYFLPHAPSFI